MVGPVQCEPYETMDIKSESNRFLNVVLSTTHPFTENAFDLDGLGMETF